MLNIATFSISGTLGIFPEITGEPILQEIPYNCSLYLVENNVHCFPVHFLVQNGLYLLNFRHAFSSCLFLHLECPKESWDNHFLS